MKLPFSFFDLETTGREPRYDQPIQVGVVRTDPDLNVISEVEIRMRPQPWTLPSPSALLVHGIGMREILDTPTSFYHGMRQIESHIAACSPSCYVAYNGMRYDEEVIRHSLFKCLLPPYATQFNGNSRFDGLKMVHATHMLRPGLINVPVVNGKTTFALEAMASANGFEGHAAHDAMGDCHAMVHLARRVKDTAPDIWGLLDIWMNKAAVDDILRHSRFVVEFAWYNKTCIYPLVAVTTNPSISTEWAVVDLTHDPALALRMTPEELADNMGSRRKILRRVKTNSMPIILSGDHALAAPSIGANRQLFESRAAAIQNDRSFAARVEEALRLYRERFDEPVHVEDQLYSRLFPAEEDRGHLAQFHQAAPPEKAAILDRLSDARARTLGLRIVAEEWPDVLPPDLLRSTRAELNGRLTSTEDVPWMTVQKAMQEIQKLRAECGPSALRILNEYEEYLRGLTGYAHAAE